MSDTLHDGYGGSNDAGKARVQRAGCTCPNCAHASDCAVHNGPALPIGPCTCSGRHVPKPISLYATVRIGLLRDALTNIQTTLNLAPEGTQLRMRVWRYADTALKNDDSYETAGTSEADPT